MRETVVFWQTMVIRVLHLSISHILEIPRAARIVEVKLPLEREFGIAPDRIDLEYNKL